MVAEKKRNMWGLLWGILLTLAGCLSVVKPLLFTGAMVWVLSALILVAGITQFASYFAIKKISGGAWHVLLAGIIDVILGLMLLLNGRISAVVSIGFCIGVWFIMSGITGIIKSFAIKKVGLKNWWVELLFGICGILAGIGMFIRPGASMVFIATFIGIYILVIGIFAIVRFATNTQL